MASTQKKSTGGKRTAPSSSGKRAGASASRSGGSRKAAPAPKPIRREVGAGVCILLSFLTALGCFHVDAWLIDLFCNLLRGLLGYGFWAVPVMLAVAGGILAFHRGRPVRLRVWCALLTPVLFGCLLHLFLASGEAPAWGWSLFPELWKSGVAMTSGGAVSGLLAQLCIAGISKYGAGAVFIVGTALLLLAAFNLTVVDVVDYIRSRPHPELRIGRIGVRRGPFGLPNQLTVRIGQLGKSRIMLVVETKLFFHNSSFFKGQSKQR